MGQRSRLARGRKSIFETCCRKSKIQTKDRASSSSLKSCRRRPFPLSFFFSPTVFYRAWVGDPPPLLREGLEEGESKKLAICIQHIAAMKGVRPSVRPRDGDGCVCGRGSERQKSLVLPPAPPTAKDRRGRRGRSFFGKEAEKTSSPSLLVSKVQCSSSTRSFGLGSSIYWTSLWYKQKML